MTRDAAEGITWHNVLPLVCFFDCLNLSLAKHLKNINRHKPPMTEELGMVSRKTPIDLKDDCWTRTFWLYLKY